MTDDSGQSFSRLNVPPINPDADIRGFARSRRGGYVEEPVDVKLHSYAEQINALVQRHDALYDEYQKLLNAEPQQSTTAAASGHFSETEEENAERIAALYREAQRNAREFVDEARERANGIAQRADEHASRVREEAEGDAAARVAEVDAYVAGARATLDLEVSNTRAALEAEVAETHARLEHETAALNAVRERLAGETQEIFSRLREFHTTQLDTLGQYEQSVNFQYEQVGNNSDEPAAEVDTEVQDADVEVPTDESTEEPIKESAGYTDAVDVAEADTADAGVEVEDAEVSEPVESSDGSAASEPEVFTPEEPVEAPEASTSYDLPEEGTAAETGDEDAEADDSDTEIHATGGDPDDEDAPKRTRRWRR